MEFKELNYPNTSRAERVQANLEYTMQFIKDCKMQTTEISLSIISQCQIDISYTLALMLDEMKKNRGKSEEKKSGLHWIERFDNENKWLECPHCHLDSAEAYNYCPNCGAKFKEEKRGADNE